MVTSPLGELVRLAGVPFNCLVADARMLPPESVRFFFLDRNWLTSMLDGVMSVADLSEREGRMLDFLHSTAHRQAFAASLRARSRRMRARRTGASPVEPAFQDDLPLCSGFLLRSAVVENWPGLVITAFEDLAGQSPLTLLRLTRLAPSVVMALFSGAARRFEITMPSQGLHFGVNEDPETHGHRVFLRGIGGSEAPGFQLNVPPVEAPMRNDRGVLDVELLRGKILEGLRVAYGGEPPPLGPGAFGIQLVVGAERQAFVQQIMAFKATPAEISPGGSCRLSWDVVNADACRLDPGDKPVDPGSGQLEVTPPETTTYTLTASRGQGDAKVESSASVRVVVGPQEERATAPPTDRLRVPRTQGTVEDLLREFRHDR